MTVTRDKETYVFVQKWEQVFPGAYGRFWSFRCTVGEKWLHVLLQVRELGYQVIIADGGEGVP